MMWATFSPQIFVVPETYPVVFLRSLEGEILNMINLPGRHFGHLASEQILVANLASRGNFDSRRNPHLPHFPRYSRTD